MPVPHRRHRGRISINIDLLLQFPHIHDAVKQEVPAKTTRPLLKYGGYGRYGGRAKMSLCLWVSANKALGLSWYMVLSVWHLLDLIHILALCSTCHKDALFLGK